MVALCLNTLVPKLHSARSQVALGNAVVCEAARKAVQLPGQLRFQVQLGNEGTPVGSATALGAAFLVTLRKGSSKVSGSDRKHRRCGVIKPGAQLRDWPTIYPKPRKG
jgi:hypothetical protein